MNNVYFSNEGMTSTNANYYCNIAKELQNAATERLNSVKFFSTSVAVIGSTEKQLMADGIKSLDFISEDLQTQASMNAFCAWVREAIKEKENQSNIISRYTLEDWAKSQGITIPERPKSPDAPRYSSDEDIINSWDINKRNKYLRLEAFAATYGKYIHPDGAYNKARKKAHSALNNPISKEGTGRDMILYYTDQTVSIDKVDSMFMLLQDQYRSYEKELNQMKAEIKETLNNLIRKAEDEYHVELDNYREQYDKWNTTCSELRSQFFKWRTNELERISKLKIAIPDSLKDVFKTIKAVADTSK